MKKMFTQRLVVYMTLALAFTVIAIFTLQTIVCQRSNTQTSYNKLADVVEKLQSNQEEVDQLTASLGENNLAKSRAFANLLEADPSIITSRNRMNEIMDRLMVDELHIIDENGIITHSTVDAYVGFDMGSGAQSAAFLVLLEDPSIELVQEPQKNAAGGILMQYIGVARLDAPGLVQVAVHPEVLEQMLAGTQIDVVVRDIDFGETGYVYAVDASTGLILAHSDSSLIGKSASEAGIPASIGEGSAAFSGVKGFYVAEEYDGKYIGTFMPSAEYYEERINQTMVVSLSMFVLFSLLLFMINRLVDRKIVGGILSISDSMKEIAGGNYSICVNETGNPEFTLLSDSINTMVAGIRSSISENEALLLQQKEDMEHNLSLIRNVKKVCANLNQSSRETTLNADNIYNGAEEQKKSVGQLQNIMDELVSGLNASAGATEDVASNTENAVDRIAQTKRQMESLKESMRRISDMTATIEKIIGEIESIASQTNMLSLNASIEAARAGELGRGFAVVATQVGELAARSAQAAKQTGELIMNSVQAVEQGREITDKTVAEFNHVVEDIEAANQSVEEITGMVHQNVSIVSKAMSELHLISDVVDKNVEISHNSKQVAFDMADEIGDMLHLVEQ